MDCVEVCPVDCFYEGENVLVIHPDECIDCGVCEPECPVDAIKPDTEPGLEKWLSINTEFAKPQEGTSGRCQRMGGGARQGTIFLTKSWRRHLITSRFGSDRPNSRKLRPTCGMENLSGMLHGVS